MSDHAVQFDPAHRRRGVVLALVGAAGVVLAACGLWLWAFGGLADLRIWAADGQRAAQNAMAGALRGLRAGHPGAIWSLCAVTFAYGLFHAVGPGHGKVVLGGYGLSRRVALRRLALLSLLASLAQATTAVVLVLAGAWVLGWGRADMTDTAEGLLAPVSYGAMALLGIYLALRGLRRGWRLLTPGRAVSAAPVPDRPRPQAGMAGLARQQMQAATGADMSSADTSSPGFLAVGRGAGCVDHSSEICPDCGHRHAPSLEEVARLTSWREALVLIAAIAVRPCTGAVFVLLLTWRMGVLYAGVLGAFSMGLGTALVTMAVAMGAAGVQRGVAGLPGAMQQGRWIAAGLELFAGALVAVICLGLLWSQLAVLF
ncbi:nickel/cobalt transporter [Tritonibacter multivorans]|uniref:nickel/cobalt transporter n=1 Tax=Tritonibacter multivorans TaxID=928856 RepID=UPI001F32E527|nr:hypothetical protein [Tritonibacter multivorans]MDA7420683.1 hypothetical protein [Tritonibacter multivorans]